jgi:hypothetical protein
MNQGRVSKSPLSGYFGAAGSKRKKSLRLLQASGKDAHGCTVDYAALQRASSAGNEAKRKHFVRFL